MQVERSKILARTTPALRDILAPGLRVVFCGINPGLSSAMLGHHFSNRTNRFWRAIHLAGFSAEEITPKDDESILSYGCGLTTVAERATTCAADLSRDEFEKSASSFFAKIAHYSPMYVAFLGKPAFSALFNRNKVTWGKQDLLLTGSRTWVLPNPSGLNRSFSLRQLVAAYSELRIAVEELVLEQHGAKALRARRDDIFGNAGRMA